MCHHEGVFESMNIVVYASYTGECQRIAQYLSKKTGYLLCSIEEISPASFENLILVFPVHCQNIPEAVKRFLSSVSVKHLAAIAAYGKMSYGNVLYEIQHRYPHTIVAGAYVPTKHSYLAGPRFEDFEKLDAIAEKMTNPKEVIIPKSFQNPLANFFPTFRGQIGVQIVRNEDCRHCGICERSCPTHAMRNGKPARRCIRCLRCVSRCPHGALSFRCRLPMALYLQKKPHTRFVMYL